MNTIKVQNTPTSNLTIEPIRAERHSPIPYPYKDNISNGGGKRKLCL